MPAAVAIPAIAAVGGALISANASSKAADAQANAAKDSNALQWNMFQQQQANQRPWQQTGAGALGSMANLMGLNTSQTFNEAKYLQEHPEANARMFNTGMSAYDDYLKQYGQDNQEMASKYFTQGDGFGSFTRQFGMGDFQADPGYAFRLAQGQKALDRAGASRGMNLSGAQIKAGMDYNQGMGSQEYGNAYSRFMNNRSTQFGQLASLAGLGQAANAQTGNMAMQTGQSMGNNLLGMGNAQAAGTVGAANAYGSGLNNMANMWQQWNQMQQQQAYQPQYGSSFANSMGGTTGNIGTDGAWASTGGGYGG